jgi:hypothetical protein
MDFPTRELRFGLKDSSAFDEAQAKKALGAQGFPNVTIKPDR